MTSPIFGEQIGSGQISSGHMVSGFISAIGVGLTSGAVVSGFIGNGAVVSGSVASGTIIPNYVTSGGIQSGMLGDASVVGGSIGSGQVASGHLASGLISNIVVGGSAVMTFGGIAVGSTARLLAWRSEPDNMVPFPHQGTRVIAPRAGTLRNLYATRLGAIANGDTMTVLVNTTPTLLVAAFVGAALGASDLANTVAVVAGDIIEIEYSSGAPLADAYQTSMEFA